VVDTAPPPGAPRAPADPADTGVPPPPTVEDGSRPRGPWVSPERLVTLAGPVAGMVVAFWLLAPVFGGRPPAGEDVMAHLVRADFGIPHLVARGRLDGWFPRFVLGHQEFLFNGPGLTWLMALVRAATFGALSNTGALKVVCIGSFVAMPPAMCFLARSYGLGRKASGLAAVLALLVGSPFGPGLNGLFLVGLVPHQVGAVLFCLALGSFLRVARHGEKSPGAKWPGVLGAVSLGGLLITHVISVMVLAFVLGLSLIASAVTRRLDRRSAGRLALWGLAGAGLAGFWLVPALAHHDLAGVVTTWRTPPLGQRLAGIVAGDILLPPGVALVMAAGWVWSLWRLRTGSSGTPRTPGSTLAWAVTPLAYLVVAHTSYWVFGENQVALQLANRGLGYAGLLGVLSLAVVGAAVSARFGTRGYLATVAVAAAVAAVWAPGRESAGQLPEPVPQMRAAAAELARLVPDGARFATERDFPDEVFRTGVTHPETWLARTSGRNSLNGFNLESSSTPWVAVEPDRLEDRPPGRSADRLARLGVTHVVMTSDYQAARLTLSGHFVPAWHRSPLTILALHPRPGGPAPASLVSGPDGLNARLTAATPEHLRFGLDSAEPAAVTVALAWSPKWHGRLDGEPVELGRTFDGLVSLELPSGPHRLALDYRGGDRWDRLGVALTLLAVLALLRAQVMSRIFSRTA
jgi:hypothetical protein